MSLAAQTVAEFGQSLGLDALELTARQGVVLSIESLDLQNVAETCKC